LSERFFLFKGCLIPTRLPFLEKASLFALDVMKVEYEAMPGATCCVEPIGLRSMAADTWILAVGRMLAIAEEAGRDVLTLCNGCYLSFQEAVEELKDLERRKEVNLALSKIGKEYHGTVQVRHLLDLAHGMGHSGLAPDVKADLSGLRVAPHSGCHVLRPSKAHLRERPYAPRMLADVAGWLGGEVVSEETWPECCGGGVASVDEAVSSGILEDVTRHYRACGANVILTPCPFCFSQFDLRQKEGVPVLHLSEMLALAFGASPEHIGLRYHRIKMGPFNVPPK
jgi:heterodisulfide reductase subunit B